MNRTGRRQDLAAAAFPRSTTSRAHWSWASVRKRVWNGSVCGFLLVVVSGRLGACRLATRLGPEGRGAFLARCT